MILFSMKCLPECSMWTNNDNLHVSKHCKAADITILPAPFSVREMWCFLIHLVPDPNKRKPHWPRRHTSTIHYVRCDAFWSTLCIRLQYIMWDVMPSDPWPRWHTSTIHMWGVMLPDPPCTQPQQEGAPMARVAYVYNTNNMCRSAGPTQHFDAAVCQQRSLLGIIWHS